MVLSYKNIEEIATTVVEDFNRFCTGQGSDGATGYVNPMPIERMAKDYLNLRVTYAPLSSDGSILGLTAYTNTECRIEENGRVRVLPLKRNQIVLDSSFIRPNNLHRLEGIRRFTLAHECAHQILFQLEADANKVAHRQKYAERETHTPRTLKTHEDWNEWQANTLGAALLMPQKVVECAIWCLTRGKPLTCYGGCFFDNDEVTIERFCYAFGVSKTAASIRLETLGYLRKRSLLEYQDLLYEVV